MRFTVTSSGADLEALTADAVKALAKANREVGKEIAKVGRKAILDDVRTHRPLRFGTKPGTGKNGQKPQRYGIGTKPKVVAGAVGTAVYFKAIPPGFWSIVEYGSAGHEIQPRFRSGERHALLFSGQYSAHADHPGTTGTHVWSGAESALDRAVFEIVGDTFDVALEVNEFHG